MDQYCGSKKPATYLHPGPTGPFLELKNEPLRPPSPITAALLQHNPSLIEICTFNSICQRLVESTSTPNASPYKPFITPSDLYFFIPPIDYSIPLTESKTNPLVESTTSPISSVGDCSPNVSSCVSTPYSSPKVKQSLQQNSPLDLCVSKDAISIVNTKHQPTNENISTCQLSGRIERLKRFECSIKFRCRFC